MEQSQQVLEWQAEAEKRAETKGKAETLLRLLQGRFGKPVPADMAGKVLATRDLAQLDRWIDAAIHIPTLDDFCQLIRA